MSTQPDDDPRRALLEAALDDVLRPLARLAMGHGMPIAAVQDRLQRAFVDAAREIRSRAGESPHRDVSQVAAMTGLNRRDVARIDAQPAPSRARRPSPPHLVYARWLTDPAWHDEQGQPCPLPRAGPQRSFETLAASVTQHVHPHSLLAAMLRLGLVQTSEDGETVTAQPGRTVPQPGAQRLYQLLGQNVGDHLAAAADNVLGGQPRHLEQAVFAATLSAEAAAEAQQRLREHWDALRRDFVPELQRMLDEDDALGRPAQRRFRMGLYTWDDRAEPGKDDGDAKA